MKRNPEPADLLAEIHAEVVVCTKCRLSRGRTRAVPGEGAPSAGIMLVGEAPGRDEDLRGRPFVGAAGQLLDQLLAEIGIRRSQVFVTNVVKCRPPENRDPLEDEIAACRDYLLAQVAIIAPRVICTLGRFAAHALIEPGLSMTECHGRAYRKHGILHVPLLHPAAALHKESWRSTLFEDVKKLGEMLAEDLGGPGEGWSEASRTGKPGKN
jgi:DNA polymerase